MNFRFGLVVALILLSQSLALASETNGNKGRSPKDVRSIIVQWKEGFEAKGRGKKLSPRGLFKESLNPSETDAVAAAARISQEEGVAFAEPDYDVLAMLAANDPSQSAQWGIPKISAPAAWDYTTGSSSVKVCVIDTGIAYTHPDLSGNAVAGYNAITNTYTDGGADDHGHGTHCAGVIGAKTNNGVGISGINWDVQVIPCKFLSSTGSGSTSDAIECMYWCHDTAGAAISSNSWGSTAGSTALLNAMTDLGNRGHLFVVAAGNNAADNDGTTNVSYPAKYNLPSQINVASTTSADVLSSFSSYGATTTHIAAPGSSIYSTIPSGYGYMSGTSMATPHVSGAVALMKAANPSLTSAELKSNLLANVDVLSSLAGYVSSSGRLNVAKAVAAVAPAIPSPSPVPVSSPPPVAASPPPPSPPPPSPIPSPSPPPPSPIPSPSPPSPSPIPSPTPVASPPPAVVRSPPPPPKKGAASKPKGI